MSSTVKMVLIVAATAIVAVAVYNKVPAVKSAFNLVLRPIGASA